VIASLAIYTGISPLDLMETPVTIINEMMKIITKQNGQK